MRRGEIAINVIVIIALSLLVLVILATILTSRLQAADQTTSSCKEVYSGTCTTETTCHATGGKTVSGADCGASTTETEGDWEILIYPSGGTVCCVQR